ncbi:MAG: peptidylprolyl isomerase [Candidatus Saccharimonadales bacterium]
MIKNRFKKAKKVKDLVPEAVAEKAAALNPLASKVDKTPSLENVPRITNETITDHREEVLKGARKYIYPLQHSKRRIVTITLGIAIVATISFLIYCMLGLYKYYQYNTFLYRVTQVVPFPIAKAGDDYVAYENYLFEIRRYVHYYQTQQQELFGGDSQVTSYRGQALTDIINDAYIKILASQNGVKVSSKEVNDRVNEVRNQNRLGSNDKVFADVLRSYWGWSVNDFKRSLKNEIVSHKVTAKLDTEATKRAEDTHKQLIAGADFSQLAKQVSDDSSAKQNEGNFGFSITKTNPNVPPEVITAIFNLKNGETSGIVLASPVLAGAGPTLEIVKVLQNNGNTATAQHISFKLKDVNTYIEQLKKKEQLTKYVKF